MSIKNGAAASGKRPKKRVLLVLCLTATYMIAEAVGGMVSNSLALLADAGHMLADVAALSISLIAFFLISRPATNRASFGYYRAEVIAALFNGVVLLVLSFFIIKEALFRFFSPSPIQSGLMMAIGVGGLIVNLIGLSLLHQDKSHNLNVRGAWLHVLSDTLGSVGVVISSILIYLFNWQVADSITSIVLACLVIYSAMHLIIETLNVLMEHTPHHINPTDVIEQILRVSGAVMVHDLHIWSITSGKEALSVHVVAKNGADYNQVLNGIQKMLEEKFAITHATIQIENECQVQGKTC